MLLENTPFDAEALATALYHVNGGINVLINRKGEYLIYNWIKSLDPEEVTGAQLGVAYLFAAGLYIKEIPDLKFENHFDAPEYNCNLITVPPSNNAPRIFPCVYEEFNELIEKRRQYVQKALGKTDVSNLPICAKEDLITPCTCEDIDDAAEKVLSGFEIPVSTWEDIFSTLDDDEIPGMEKIKELEVSYIAYLFRRTAATRITCLPVRPFTTDKEINYIMGIDADDSKNDISFASEEFVRLILKLKSYTFNENSN